MGAAGGGALGGVGGGGVVRAQPHSSQNLPSGRFLLPHEGHASSSLAPHSLQNFAPSRLSQPQDGQCMGPPPLSSDGPGKPRHQNTSAQGSQRDRIDGGQLAKAVVRLGPQSRARPFVLPVSGEAG